MSTSSTAGWQKRACYPISVSVTPPPQYKSVDASPSQGCKPYRAQLGPWWDHMSSSLLDNVSLSPRDLPHPQSCLLKLTVPGYK